MGYTEYWVIHPREKPVSIISVENYLGLAKLFLIIREFTGKACVVKIVGEC